jgi:Ca2+-binding EF-hand superfamily protein
MPELGLDVPMKDIDALFDEWDKDKGGAISYRELGRILNSTRRSSTNTTKKGK